MKEDDYLNIPLTQTIELNDKEVTPTLETSIGENEQKKDKVSNFYTAGFLSKTIFAWTHYAMQKANSDPLKVSDLTGLTEEDKAHSLAKPLFDTWYGSGKKEGYSSRKGSGLFFAILMTNLCYIIFLTLVNFALSLLKYGQIFFFRELILHFKLYHDPTEKSKPVFPIYVTVGFFLLIKVSKTFGHHQSLFMEQTLGVKTVNQVSALIYDKVTKTSIFIKNQISEGEILNFIQSDADSLSFLYSALPKIINVPFNFAVSLYMLFKFFGTSFIFGFIALLILVGIIWIVQKKYLVNAKTMLYKKDARMRITTHSFHILKILKLFGWEDEFRDNIATKRNEELTYLGKILNLTALRTFVNSNIPLLISISSIGGYTLLNGAMEITNLFTSIELVEQIATPLVEIPSFITNLIATMVSMGRIQDFLSVKDIDIQSHEDQTKPNTSIKFLHCDFGIKGTTPKENQTLLKDIELEIPKGELVGIIGETGSGKSCLVNAILDNLELINENQSNMNIIINGPISYACQDPWIMNGTIRENILFYSKFEESRYETVVKACQLKNDFENLPNGDLTEIGSTGTNISGGQRARIALARALYKKAEIYIFDDPISSVDTYVSMEIFHQAIKQCNPDKTRIFITHDTRNLSFMDRIIYMDQFKIKFNGTFNQLKNEQFFKAIIKDDTKKLVKPDKSITTISDENVPLSKEIGKLTKDEDQKKGEVTWALYNTFFKIQGGYFFFFGLIALTMGIVLSKVWSRIYLTNWSDNKEESQNSSKNLYHFTIYTEICFIGVVIQFVKEFLIARSNYRSNKAIHENMISSLIKAPINLFHDIIPIGQILNRLVHDLDGSRQIIWMFDTILNSFVGLLSAVYVCYSYNPYSLYVAPILMVIGYIIAKYFLNAARDLNRLDGISRSPAVSLFSETILGVTTIRTFKNEKESKEKFYNRIDEHLSVMTYKYGADNWFCMHLDVLSHLYLGFVIIYACLHMDSFDAQAVGLLLEYSSQFSEQLLEVMEQSTKVEKSLISLERCDAFTHISPESQKKMENEDKVLSNWPSKGEVTYTNYRMRYRPNCSLALVDINMNIKPGEKVGIVGRTGSGKSSLSLGMLRVVEALGGKITIDGVDISKVSLKKLRRSISIVPQEPFLLEGTLKDNLDPLNIYSEAEIMEVLNQVKLFDMMEASNKMTEGIRTRIKEYGNNMSFGCRQLVCFARAILRKSKIIILDEATSSVDQKTEEVIQNTVENIFKDSTVITIAHRIQTVKKCDKIFVMENGKIVETGKPEELINNEQSKFYSLYYKNMEKQ